MTSTETTKEGEVLAEPKCRYNVVNVLACPRIKRIESGIYQCDYCGMSVEIDRENVK